MQQCSVSKACKLVKLSRTNYPYQNKPKDDSGLQDALTSVIDKHPSIGFWQSFHRNRLIHERSAPSTIRVDNGPEFISHVLQQWCDEHKITLQFIQPGRPMQNAYIERKNGSMRRELLNTYLFNSLTEVRIMAEEWRVDYNEERPHKSLRYLSPVKYAEQRPKSSNKTTFIHKRRMEISKNCNEPFGG